MDLERYDFDAEELDDTLSHRYCKWCGLSLDGRMAVTLGGDYHVECLKMKDKAST